MNLLELQEKLKTNTPSIGTWAQIPSTESASILASLGYDWVVADLEHAAFTRADLPNFFRAIKLAGSVPFARLADNTRENVKAALDSGAEGLIFPMIESREMLDNAIALSLYPSASGVRGVGYCAANLYGYEFDSYTHAKANDVVLIAQIEHKNALEHLDLIMSHPRLNGIIVGPYDLSASLGLMGQTNHPEVQKALAVIKEKAEQYNVPMGLHIVRSDEDELQKKIDEGYRFIAYGIDTVFLWENAQLPLGAKR